MQGDIGLLSRALNNLIGNSVRHNRSCRIEMSGELIAENGLSLCRIGVKDDGKGIPPEIRELLTQDQGYRDVQEQETGRMVGKPHVMGKPPRHGKVSRYGKAPYNGAAYSEADSKCPRGPDGLFRGRKGSDPLTAGGRHPGEPKEQEKAVNGGRFCGMVK